MATDNEEAEELLQEDDEGEQEPDSVYEEDEGEPLEDERKRTGLGVARKLASGFLG
jgi:hypothetical protein